MSENLQKMLKEALLNNSYDYDAMHLSLAKTWESSYSYLYAKQKAEVEYEELFYFSNDEVSHKEIDKIGHLYLDELIYANFDIDYDVIHVMDREEYRTSRFYLHFFTIEDMANHPEIFSQIPIVIIDDKVIWDYKIKATKDYTRFKLPFRRRFVLKDERNPVTDEYIYVDHKVQVLVVDNIFYNRMRVNRNTIHYSSALKTIRIAKSDIRNNITTYINKTIKSEIMAQNKESESWYNQNESKLGLQKITYTKKLSEVYKLPSQDGIMFASIHFINQYNGGYELGTQLIPLTISEDGNYYVGKLTDDINEKLDQHTGEIFVSLVFANRLYHHTFYNGDPTTSAEEHGASLLVLEDKNQIPYTNPIPTENFMVFKKGFKNKGYVLEKNVDMLEMHYPNIYRIKDSAMESGDVYDVYYFYYRDDSIKYTDIFDFYFYFLKDIFPSYNMERIINDIYYNKANLSQYTEAQKKTFRDVFKKIFDYQYYHHNYGELDFLHRYILLPENTTKVPVEYKDETLKQWIRVQPYVLRDYVLDQKKLGDSFHLFTNTVDLTKRVRTSTANEFGKENEFVFDEKRYVFAIANEQDYPILLNCRVFVDGIMIGDLYHDRRFYTEYLYIPCKNVTADSYIEIEIFPSYSFSKEVTFTSMNQTERVTLIEPKENIYPTQADIYYQEENPDNHYTRHLKRYDPKLFNYTMHYKEGDYTFDTPDPVHKPVKFTRLKTFTIQPNSTEVLNKKLKLRIDKKTNNYRFMMARNGYPMIEMNDHDFQFNTDYIRVFRNGRLMPRSKYRLLTTYVKPRLLFMEWMNRGDIIYVDVTPYRYTEIYYQEELKAREPLIDLRGIIDKPFDIRYYDVYVNGRKLSVNNVFTISPWQITLVNLKSIYNLVIYERERDWEYFGLDYKENIYYFTIDDLFKSGIVSEDEKNKVIRDIIDDTKDPRLHIYPNTNDEEKLNFQSDELIYAIFHIFYFDELIPKNYVNPDVKQFSVDVMKDNYIEVYERYNRVADDSSVYDFEKERRKNYPPVLCLDPDIYIKSNRKEGDKQYFVFTNSDFVPDGAVNVDTFDIRAISPYYPNLKLDDASTYYIVPVFDGYQAVYCVGHIGEVEQKLLDQSGAIHIPDITDL